MSALTELSAAELARRIRARKVSATEAMTEAIAAARRAHERLNCFIRIDEDAALAAARTVDAEIAQGRVRGPLAGVPMAHKDMYYREGVPSSCGSRITRERPAPSTATALKRLDTAGALQFGVLNMTEFAYGPTGHNYHYGHCRNAWNPGYITGGSSSGAGTSVAARANFAALGSDTGGSIRLPAHFCGVCGIKPTYGRVSRAGAMPLSFSLDTLGPLARTVEDCALVLGVIAGRDAADPTASQQPVPDYLAALGRPVRGLRIGVPKGFFYDGADPAIDQLMRASLDVFRELGCEIVEVAVPAIEPWNQAATAIIAAEAAALHANWLRERPQDYSEQVRARLELGAAVGAIQYINALRLRDQALKTWLAEVMATVDAVHAPCVSFATPTIAETDVGGGQKMGQVLAQVTRLMRPVNYLGLPSLAVPCGFQPHGLPCAFQLIGRPFDEALLFRLGHAYQRATDWHLRSPGS
ncbi:MAG: amidase [Betaproteobacteria bacterium]|nr:amidase [Betaproteobacteria bacterium]